MPTTTPDPMPAPPTDPSPMLPDFGPPPWSTEQAALIGEEIGVVWSEAKFDVYDFLQGLSVELEHGTVDPMTNVTDDCAILTGRIALAHLLKDPRHYVATPDDEGEPSECGICGWTGNCLWVLRCPECDDKEYSDESD